MTVLQSETSATPVAPPATEVLTRRTGVEVAGNWVIDRDFGIVRRRYWGKVATEGRDYPEV